MTSNRYIESPVNAENPSIFTDDMLNQDPKALHLRRAYRLHELRWRKSGHKFKTFKSHSYDSFNPRYSLNHQQWSFK